MLAEVGGLVEGGGGEMILVHKWIYYLGLLAIGWMAGNIYSWVFDLVRWLLKRRKKSGVS